MNRHASMNRVYRLLWSVAKNLWVVASELARGRGKRTRSSRSSRAQAAATAVTLALAPLIHAGPTGGQVTAGSGSITQSGNTTTIEQSSSTLSINWQSFNIAAQQTVDFVQPSSSAVAVNRVLGNSATQILGHLDANGQIYLINPNGVLFGKGAEVNVGGLVASTLDLGGTPGTDTRSFAGSGAGSVINEGRITAANGGYVALLGNHVGNSGVISAELGSVALGAGSAVTLTFSGERLVQLQVDKSVLQSLTQNGGLIQADGGRVFMTAGARDSLLASVVNNTGVIQARTVENHEGTITLLGGMAQGSVQVDGRLDASAPRGGDGGSVETSGAHVEIADEARITTASSAGLYGSWLIDPKDFTVAASGGDITGAALSTNLASTAVILQSSQGSKTGSGNVNVDDAVSWSANTRLTLTASNDVDVNANVSASGATASLFIKPNTANGGQAASGAGTLDVGAGASITLSGTKAALSIASPAYTLGAGSTINLPNVSPASTTALVIGGTPYAVINSLGAAGSTTGTDLQGIAGNLTGNYALGRNLDATATATWNSGAGFNPIGSGTGSSAFSGIFDGLGHSIGNLSINRPTTAYVGLFGSIGNTSAIRNVGVAGGSVSGLAYAGGLVGRSFGMVSGSYATDTVSGSIYAGGLVGDNDGAITGSHATGRVSGGNYVGGLSGSNYGTVTNSYATGSISGSTYVGGLVGESASGSVSFSHATGNVAGNTAVGGLVGINFGTVTNSYAAGAVTSTTYAGGLIGYDAGPVSDSGATGNVSASTMVGGLVGIANATTISISYATGAATGQASAVGGLVGDSENTTITGSHATGSASGTSLIGGLVGTSNYGSIINSYATGTVTGAANAVGGLVGNASGSIQNSYATGAVTSTGVSVGGLVGFDTATITDSYSTGLVSGAGAVGGLVGNNNIATVSSSFWDITTSGQSTSGGGTGLTDAQMHSAANFNGFTFTTTPGATGNSWVIVDADGTLNNAGGAAGATLPMLASEYSTSINNAHQLQLVAMNLAASYSLGQNIDASATGNGGDVWGNTGFAPIGTSGTPFAGTFDGAGYTVRELTINQPAVNNMGLFGTTGSGATIRNIGLIGASVAGATYVGAVVGVNGGTLSNSYAEGGLTVATGNSAGGLVGNNSGTVTLSHASQRVEGSNYVGGLVGFNAGTVSDSYATGAVTAASSVGGLIGWNYGGGNVNNSYATGSASGSGSTIGGLVGLNYGSVATSYSAGAVDGPAGLGGLIGANTGTVANSYWNTTTSGQSSSAGGTGLTTAQMQSSANFTGFTFTATPGATGNAWVIVDADGSLNNDGSASGATSPLLASEYSITITNAHQLQLMAMNSAASYTLARNIDAAATSNGGDVWGSAGFAPIAVLSGTFDGFGNAISGLSINMPSLQGAGLFGLATASSVIRNVGLIGASVHGAGDTGALAGSDQGTINNSYATGSVSGTNLVGGLVGDLTGSIGNSYASVAVTGSNDDIGGLVGLNKYESVSNSYASGSVSGVQEVGGLIGVNSGRVDRSYATGLVTGVEQAGGLIGSGPSSSVTNSFWDTQTSGRSSSAGGVGMTTANMQTGANFTSATVANGNVNPNWDFSNTWVLYDGRTYPLLTSFMTPLTITANNLTKTYDGSAFSGGNGVSYSAPVTLDLNGTFSFNGSSQGAINVGAYAITPGGVYSDQQGYDIRYVGGTLQIDQLGSVAWVGGKTGNWSTASNWAGGAIPDFSNVASVTIPKGTTVTYDAGVPATTQLETFTDSGKLILVAGTLQTSGDFSAAGYQQTGGTLGVGGTFTIDSTVGTVTLGNLNAAAANIVSTAGLITQSAGTTISVTGATSLTADNGLSGSNSQKFNITLAQATDSFGGPVSADGLNVALVDNGGAGLTLGNVATSGTLALTSRAGAITQSGGSTLDATGASTLTADNGLSGAGDVKYDIALGAVTNNFIGAVAANAQNVTLTDGVGGIVLGTITAKGTLSVDSVAGAITQAASKLISAPGASTFTADNGVAGAGDVKYNVTLANAGDNFVGTVSTNGLNIKLEDSAGGVKLGATTASAALTVTSLAGAITQATGTSIGASGVSTLTADNGMGGAGDVKYGITLANAGNNFIGAVNGNGAAISLEDGIGGLTLGNITASGKLSVTSLNGAITEAAGKTINVSGASALTADNGVSGAADIKYNVSLAQAGNELVGAVTATGNAITLADATAMSAILNSSGASSLNAAGALVVSGTVATNLTTVTTGGSSSTTTFAATTVGNNLNVTSPGAVQKRTPSTVLTVHGAGTGTPNSHVTVNGAVGATIQ